MRKFSKSRILSIVLAAAMTASTLAGCSSAPATSSQAPASGAESADSGAAQAQEPSRDFAELNFYMMNSPVTDQDRVMEKANAIIQEKLNAKLNFVMVDGGTYPEKINLMINSGEEFDLCFMAFWGGMNFYENASKGAFADMTELLPKYAPQTYAHVPESLWKSVTVDGKICAAVNYQQWGSAKRNGIRLRLDMAEEAGFDWKSLKDKSTIEAMKLLGDNFFGPALAKHPDKIGWETSSTYSFFLNDPLYWDMEPVGDMVTPGWINYEAPEKVINQFETEEFKQYCEIMRDWYNKGYVRKDGATLKDVNPDRQAGKILAQWEYSWPDTLDFPPTGVKEITMQGVKDAGYTLEDMSMTAQPGAAPAVSVSLTRTVMPATAGSNACIAISSTSKNKERAMEVVELLNTNDELFNLVQWGEENVDYKYDENGNFTNIDGKYNFNWNEWQIGQSFNADYTRSNFAHNQKGDDQKAKLKIVYDADKTAEESPVTGFEFNPDPVKTELANCSAIITEMIPAFSNGSIDPTENLPKFLKRLQDAGVEKIIVEKQRQYDEFRGA